MVVATGTGHGQSLGSLRQDVDLVVDLVSPRLDRVGRGIQYLPQPVPTGSDWVDVVRAVCRQPRRHQVARDLLLQEAVVGQVGVERFDDVVTEPPSVELVVVEFMTVRFGPAHQVQPVSPPALPVVRRAEQPFDGPHVGSLGGIGQERVDLGRCRRQASQIEGHSSQQRPPIHAGRRLQSLGFQPGEDKPINIGAHPVRIANCRQRRLPDGPKAPELAAFRKIDAVFLNL